MSFINQIGRVVLVVLAVSKAVVWLSQQEFGLCCIAFAYGFGPCDGILLEFHKQTKHRDSQLF